MESHVTLSIEELAQYYVEHTGRHVSEIARVDRIGDDITIKFVDRTLVLEALAWANNHCYGDKKAYIVSLIEGDIEANWPEEKVDTSKEEFGQGSVTAVSDDVYDSPTYGDLQSPSAESIREEIRRKTTISDSLKQEDGGLL